MKTKIIISMIALFAIVKVQAQETSAEIKIKVSSVCGMCKSTIEKGLAFEKGVKRSDLKVSESTITVIYNPKKTTPEKIRLAISNIGYDADEVKANPKAYDKLDACCKKDQPIHE